MANVDALLVPYSLDGGGDLGNKVDTVVHLAANLMGVDPNGPKPVMRAMGGQWFVTRTHADTLLYPTDHPLSRQDRYDWSYGENGISLGTLKQV